MIAKQIEKKPLTEQVAEILRQNIVSGSLPAGAPLKQEELSDRFGVSMGALREALRTLHSDGLVTMAPNRGAMVSDLSAEEAAEIFDIRLMLETGALGLAFPKIRPKDISQAEKLILRMDAAKDVSKWSGLNRQFHEAIYQAAGRPRLLALIANLHDNVGRYMSLYLDTMNYQAQSQAEHRDLLAAISRRDLEAARFILSGHLELARAHLVEYLKGDAASKSIPGRTV